MALRAPPSRLDDLEPGTQVWINRRRGPAHTDDPVPRERPMISQYTMQDPTSQYPTPKFDEQQQTGPGLAREMTPKPDHGESSYVGSGRLEGRKAVITGADSGIGRAVAIAFAREG